MGSTKRDRVLTSEPLDHFGGLLEKSVRVVKRGDDTNCTGVVPKQGVTQRKPLGAPGGRYRTSSSSATKEEQTTRSSCNLPFLSLIAARTAFAAPPRSTRRSAPADLLSKAELPLLFVPSLPLASVRLPLLRGPRAVGGEAGSPTTSG